MSARACSGANFLLDDDGLVRAFVGERCYSDYLMSTQVRVPIVGGLFRADHFGAIDKFIELAEGGLPERLDIYKNSRQVSPSYVRPFSSLITPALLDNVRGFYETRATVQSAQAAIAIQAWRLDGGDLPEDSTGFPDSVREHWPIDPFSGDPLLYKRLEEGYVIYSVGGDLEDDGGTVYKEDEGRDVQDVRFTILK